MPSVEPLFQITISVVSSEARAEDLLDALPQQVDAIVGEDDDGDHRAAPRSSIVTRRYSRSS